MEEPDRAQMESSLQSFNSLGQIKKVVEDYQGLLGGRLDSMRTLYKAGTGRDDFGEKLLSPATKRVFSNILKTQGGSDSVDTSQVGAEQGAGDTPSVGTIEQGYKFKGGNPADQSSWEKVE